MSAQRPGRAAAFATRIQRFVILGVTRAFVFAFVFAFVVTFVFGFVATGASGCHSDKAHRAPHRKGPAPTVGGALADDPAPPPAPPAPPPVPVRVVAPTPPPRPAAPPPPPRPAPRPIVEKKPKPSKPASFCDGGRGPRFAVWGVDPSDVLNVRAEPNAKSEVLGELPPNATGVSLAGDKDVGSWRKIECGKISGWVNGRFLSREKAGQ